jgi:hypothetical protein
VGGGADVSNRWIDGAHNRSTIKRFYAAGGEGASRGDAFELDAGEHAAGHHWLVVGRVRRLRVSADADPLVYLAGGFGACDPH